MASCYVKTAGWILTSRFVRRPTLAAAKFGLAAVCLSVGLMTVAFFAADTYAHRKFDNVIAMNREGYRGPVVPHHHPGDKRVVVLGGSTAFCYGVAWWDSWPAQLQGRLAHVSVVNLGYNAEGAAAMRPTLEDYAYLKPDLAILYEGYNDLGGENGLGVPNTQVYRRQSPLFHWTGYYAILPLVLHEKFLALSSGGQLDAAYKGEKVVFHPGAAASAEIGVLKASDVAVTYATGYLTRPADVHPEQVPAVAAYLAHIDAAVQWALAQHMAVLAVGQPTLTPTHIRQQAALQAMIAAYHNPRVQYVNLGAVLRVKDPAMSPDGMHLTVAGNRLVAGALADPVRQMLR